LQAISLLAKSLKLRAAAFNYCGTKDKRAKTSQWISVKKIEPSKIVRAARKISGIRVGNFKFGQSPFKLGQLTGNRFQIALRSIDADEETISKACNGIKENGFINYYGMQRFGNCASVPTHEIGKALIKSDFKKAVELILQERDGEPHFMKKMRECWKITKDASEALKCVDQRQANFIEVKVLQALAKSSGNNYLQALESLPRNMLMLYMHAYQSLLFNKVVSKRRELGLSVIEGDLVLKESTDVQLESLIDENSEPAENDEEVCEEPTATESKFIDMVRPLTKEDVESGKYTIFDIVLALPGYDVQYPKGAIGDYYQELLSNDDLTSEKFKNNLKVLSMGGAYRKVFIKPTEFQFKFLNYEMPNDDLILSDFSRLMKDPEIESKPEGKNRALVLDFKLPPSCYATMLLRELLKTDTSTQTQMQLQKDINESTDDKAVDLKRKLEVETNAGDENQEKITKLE
jgi:tRNA pseudouridine13 synthase